MKIEYIKKSLFAEIVPFFEGHGLIYKKSSDEFVKSSTKDISHHFQISFFKWPNVCFIQVFFSTESKKIKFFQTAISKDLKNYPLLCAEANHIKDNDISFLSRDNKLGIYIYSETDIVDAAQTIKHYYRTTFLSFCAHFDSLEKLDHYFNDNPNFTYLKGTFSIIQGIILAKIMNRNDIDILLEVYYEKIKDINNPRLLNEIMKYYNKLTDKNSKIDWY